MYMTVYEPQQDTYDTLHQYPYKNFTMGIVNNLFILVGGQDVLTGKKTNKLGVWNEQSKTWTHRLSPMTTACSLPSVDIYNDRWLIVIGGESDGGSILTS